MEKNACHIGLELTSHSVKLVAGFVLNDLVYVLDMMEEECGGLENGLIVDSDLAVQAIRNVVNRASKNLHIAIREVSIALPPFGLQCFTDTGATNTIDGNDIIRHVDTVNILTAMKKRALSDPDLKIIDIVPDTFIINGNERYAVEPIGKTSQVLSLHASIYAMSEKVIGQFANCIAKAGFEVRHRVIAPYANALYLSTNSAIPSSYILLDIGHSVTTVSQVHKRTSIVNSKMLRFGGETITKAISERFNIEPDEAEELKRVYGIDRNPSFPVYLKNEITFDDLSEAITGVLIPALESVREIIRNFSLEDNEKLPVVIIGGTSDLNNLEKIVADTLETSVIDFTMETIGARDKSLITALGIIRYCAIQPQSGEEENISTSITRVDQKKNSRNYKFDEEL